MHRAVGCSTEGVFEETPEVVEGTSAHSSRSGAAVDKKIQRLFFWRDRVLTIVNELFPVRSYFPTIDSYQGEKVSESACSIRILKNLYHAVIQQYHEKPMFDDLAVIPCRHPIKTETQLICGREIGVAACQGHRPTMEDRHLVIELGLVFGGEVIKTTVCGLFDGHAGSSASQFMREHLAEHLKAALEKNISERITEESVFRSLKECFRTLNETYEEMRVVGGTTAVVAIILNGKIYIANVGDSRAILLVNGRVIQLSQDAKPDDVRFEKKIIALGGCVQFFQGAYRVNGVVSTARAVGDFYDLQYKRMQGVSPIPKISCFPLAEIKNGLLLLCCDGFFEVVHSTNSLITLLWEELRSQPKMSELAQKLVRISLDAGSRDNLTAITIPLLSP